MIAWVLDHPLLVASITAMTYDAIKFRRFIVAWLRWLPSEMKAEWYEKVLKLPDARKERPDYSNWRFVNTMKEQNPLEYDRFKYDGPTYFGSFSINGFIIFFVVLIPLALAGDYLR